MKLSLRTWISIITFVLIVLILFFSRHELLKAWQLVQSVNLWILVLFIPLLLLNYYATGEMVFSYLRRKNLIKHVSWLEQVRLSLETNFVNHVMPSGGASGITYMTLRLKEYNVSASKATMAQVVRFATGFAAFIGLMVIAEVVVTIDGNVNRWLILMTSSLVSLLVMAIIVGGYILVNANRARTASRWIAGTVNILAEKVTFGHKKNLIKLGRAEEFLLDMHQDVLALKSDRRILIEPFVWAVIFLFSDVAMYFVAFWSLGEIVNPASILLAYGIATIAGFIVVTPGGAGAYEALMVSVLGISGLSQGTALAGVVLARVIILLVILLMGYAFYQHSLIRYGDKKNEP